jgi:hypothetical protein
VCWASLEVGADYDGALRTLALQRIQRAEGLVALAAATRAHDTVLYNRAQAAAEIARRERHRAARQDGGYVLTDAGRDAPARAEAEAWLFGLRQTAEAATLGVAA